MKIWIKALVLCLGSVPLTAAPLLKEIVYPAGSAPAGCQSTSGLYPINERVGHVWAYEKYAVVMPSYRQKQAQSFDCSGQKGTVYFYEYATPEKKDKAVLFAGPILSQGGASIELQEWSKGFAVLSFARIPESVRQSLTERMSGTASATTATTLPKPPVTVPPITRVPSVSIKEMVTPGPTVAADPFAPSAQPALTARKVVSPAAPVARVAAPMVIAPPTPSPAPGGSDLPIRVLESYAAKIGCDTPQRQAEIVEVCTLMQDFASGLPPEFPLQNGAPRIGPLYTMDSYGRFTDLHSNALVGTDTANTIAFFTLESRGGLDAFEIKSLIEARKTKTALPDNRMAGRIKELSRRKRFNWTKTSGRSLMFNPVPERTMYVRRAGDRLILIGTSGATLETQIRSSLIVAVLY